jgi:hypothetical protein
MALSNSFVFLSRLLAVFFLLCSSLQATYRIGTVKADISGPDVCVGFMGMSNPLQKGNEIHTRLFSRAFVIEDAGAGSLLHVEWVIPANCDSGDYKITYKGKIKPFPGIVKKLFVETKTFQVQ